ncbi:MAG: addiction module protein [Pseudomonas sp.]|nr:addiction module protein [Pseudomonas sp.]
MLYRRRTIPNTCNTLSLCPQNFRKEPTVSPIASILYFPSLDPIPHNASLFFGDTLNHKRKKRCLPICIPRNTIHMIDFVRSKAFGEWLNSLRDTIGKARIIARLRAAEHGSFGDCESVGESVYEMRVHHGPGYRMYFTRRGEVVYLLLLGGDKSTQKRDIKRAIQMAQTIGEE